MADDKKSSFDRLVAGLSSEDRVAMLERINSNIVSKVQFTEMDKKTDEYALSLIDKLENESIFYKFILWLRSLFQKKTTVKIYNEDIIARIAKKINKNHAGIIKHKHFMLDSLFYERLRNLKDASDFFKPYIILIDENPGDFYVFLSSFVASELSDKINEQADPFILSFGQEPSMDIKNNLLKKLDEILKNIEDNTKANLYNSIIQINWLKEFTMLPFIHFISQFTNIAGNDFSCSYSHAKYDFNEFAAVFGNIKSIDNEVLEAVYLYSQRKELTKGAPDKDIERAMKEFMSVASEFLDTIQMFILGVPIFELGKVINNDYNWEPKQISGVEAWFPSFRSHWRKIFDIRWNEWIKERKKNMLASNLNKDFELKEFPALKYRPWANMWGHVTFNCELTGGFLCWFTMNMYNKIIETLNSVALEGVFIRSENRTEYAESVNLFSITCNKMISLVGKLSPDGEYGHTFQELIELKVRNISVQNKTDKMLKQVESEIREITKEFGKACRSIERVFHGFFDEKKDGIHEGLQNINTIKGRQNREWRDSILKIRDILRKCIFYISELEPIETVNSNA